MSTGIQSHEERAAASLLLKLVATCGSLKSTYAWKHRPMAMNNFPKNRSAILFIIINTCISFQLIHILTHLIALFSHRSYQKRHQNYKTCFYSNPLIQKVFITYFQQLLIIKLISKEYIVMKQSDDQFDHILSEADQFYSMGAAAGSQQANTYDMAQIQSEGFAFGQELGEEIAFYQQFIKALQRMQVPEGKLNQKVYPSINFIKEVIHSLDFQKIQSLKSQRKQLKHRFKILLAMLGVKNYQRMKGEQAVIAEQNEGFDF